MSYESTNNTHCCFVSIINSQANLRLNSTYISITPFSFIVQTKINLVLIEAEVILGSSFYKIGWSLIVLLQETFTEIIGIIKTNFKCYFINIHFTLQQ